MNQLNILEYVPDEAVEKTCESTKSEQSVATIDVGADELKSVVTFDRAVVDEYLKKLLERELSVVGDISTESGRKELASRAYKIAQQKNEIKRAADALKEDHQKVIKEINKESGRIWDEMESIQHKVRKPLTDWENKEKERVKVLEARLSTLTHIASNIMLSESATNTRADVPALEHSIVQADELYRFEWEEFSEKAKSEYDLVSSFLHRKMAERKKFDEDQAELEKLRKEKEDAEKFDTLWVDAHDENARLDKAAKESAEKARKVAEEQAAIELNWAQAHQENSEFDRMASERREQEAKAEAEDARWQVIYADADSMNAAFDSRVAEENRRVLQADYDAWMAIYNEAMQDNAAYDATKKAEKDQADRDAEKARHDKAREEDIEHRKKINNEAKAAIMKVGSILDAEERAQAIVEAIIRGLIPNVKINY